MSSHRPLSPADPGEAEQDVRGWGADAEEAAEAAEEHGRPQGHAGPAADPLRQGEPAPPAPTCSESTSVTPSL